MKYVESGYSIRINWVIQRGASKVSEDFRRASLFVFLLGQDNVWPVTYTLEDNVIKAVIESGLPEGVYSLKAIWYKDSLFPFDKKYLRNGRCSHTCGRVSQSQVDHVFGVTALASESESAPENTLYIDLITAVATYGYDGLSAYEIAVMSGQTTVPQGTWIGNLTDLNDRMREIEDAEQGRQSAEKLRSSAEYVRTQNEEERQNAERVRVSSFQSFEQSEQAREAQEVTRVSSEAERVLAEQKREQAFRELQSALKTYNYYAESSGKATLKAPQVNVEATGSGQDLTLKGYKVVIEAGMDDIVLKPGSVNKVKIDDKQVATVDMFESIKDGLMGFKGQPITEEFINNLFKS